MATRRSSEVEQTLAREKAVAQFSARIERWLLVNLPKVLAGVEDRNQSDLERARVLGSLPEAMRTAGLETQLAAIQEIYGQDLQAIAQSFKGVRRSIYSDVDRPMLETLIKGGFDQAGSLIQKYIADVQEVVGLAVLSGERPDVRQIVDEEGKNLAGRLETEINTTVSAFHRSVTLSKSAELGFDLFEYVGPLDQSTRDFCEETLGRNPPIYTAAEIASLDNGQGLPVAQYGGGYNCRHTWEPISEEEARDRGWKP